MKKILTIILFLISLQGLSQVKQVYNQYGGEWKKFWIKTGLRLPMSPVSTKDLNLTPIDSGQIYYSPTDSSIQYHTGFQWLTLKPGYTTLSQFVDETAWRTFYSNASGDMTGLPFGTSGKVLTSNGVSAAPTWETPSGATPTLQQVIDVNGTFNNASINVDGFNGGYIKFIQLSDPLNMEGGDNILKINRDSDAFGTEFDFSLQTALRNIKLPDYAGIFAVHPTIVGQAGKVLAVNGGETALEWITGGGGAGTVTSVSRTNGYGIIASVADPTTTPNITIAADTTHVVSKFDRQFLIDSLQSKGWGPTGPSSETVIQYWMDVSGSTQANFYPSGTGNTVPSTAIATGWMGGRQLSTSTSTTGGGYIYFGSVSGYAPIPFTPAVRFNYITTVRLEDLSDGTETFSVVAGFGDEANNYSAIVDGAGFRYQHADSSGTWIAWTKDNSTITEDATDITVAADTDYDFYVTVIGTVAYFYIDDVLKATITTNVPDGVARQTSSVTYNKKSAGTTPRFLYVKRLGIGVQNQ